MSAQKFVAAGILAVFGTAIPAAAAPVLGQISLGGYAQGNNGSMGTASGISFANAFGTSVTGTSGSVSSYGAGSGSFAQFGSCASFSGCGTVQNIVDFATARNISNFLTFGSGQKFSFDLIDIDSITHSANSTLNFTALGTIHLAGYSATRGVFYLTAQGDGITSYSAAVLSSGVVAAVPETATWAMMIAGFGMVGFAMRRRSSVKTTVRFA